MSEKLNVTELRKIVFAEMNVASYRTKVFSDLLAELDSRAVDVATEETKEVVAKTKAKATKTKEKAPEVVEETEAEETISEDSDDMFGDEAEADQGPTLEDVRKVVKDFATKHGKEKCLKMLSKFGVTSIPDIKKQDYPKVIALAKKYL